MNTNKIRDKLLEGFHKYDWEIIQSFDSRIYKGSASWKDVLKPLIEYLEKHKQFNNI